MKSILIVAVFGACAVCVAASSLADCRNILKNLRPTYCTNKGDRKYSNNAPKKVMIRFFIQIFFYVLISLEGHMKKIQEAFNKFTKSLEPLVLETIEMIGDKEEVRKRYQPCLDKLSEPSDICDGAKFDAVSRDCC